MDKRFSIEFDLLIRELGASISDLIVVHQGFGSIDQAVPFLKMNLWRSLAILIKKSLDMFRFLNRFPVNF
jgi:hypothetical protein